MDHREEDRELEQNLETEPEREARPDPSQLNAFERLYEHFRRVPLRYLDIFIWVCVVALIIVVTVGILKAQGF